jgi:hypothetical protein
VKDADRVLARVLTADPEARAEWEENFKHKNDPRVIRIGHLLRVASFDELPQLFNVVTGDVTGRAPADRCHFQAPSTRRRREGRCRS